MSEIKSKEWRRNRFAQGLCQNCPNPRRPGRRTCKRCSEKNTNARKLVHDDRVARGLCIYCPASHVVAALTNRKGCSSCLAKLSQQIQGLYANRLRQGRCITCAKNDALDGEVRCVDCKAINRAKCSQYMKIHSHERWLQLKVKVTLTGLCQNCAEHNPVKPGAFKCDACRERDSRNRVKTRAA